MRIRFAPTRFVYPDLSVVRGRPDSEYKELTLLNPLLIVEVTSSSWADYDRGSKREYYGDIAAIQAYLVIDHHRVLVELYTRTGSGWDLRYFSDLEDAVSLEALGCSLPLANVYCTAALVLQKKPQPPQMKTTNAEWAIRRTAPSCSGSC